MRKGTPRKGCISERARRWRLEVAKLLGQHATISFILSDLGQCSQAQEARPNCEIARARARLRVERERKPWPEK